MTTLADITRQTSRLVNRHATGSATSSPGNATTLPDTVGLAGYPDDQWNGGTIWITSGTNAGKSRAVTDFTDSSDTLTFAAFTGNIVSGVTYEVADGNFVTYQDLRQAVNLALREIGKVLEAPDETLTTVADQITYDLPAGVADVTHVYVVTDIGEATEEQYLSSHWEERQGQLFFDKGKEPAADLTLRIYYRVFHSELTADADELDTQVDDQYLVYLAARHALRLAYKHFDKAGEATIPEWLNEAAEQAKAMHRHNQGMPLVRIRTA
jgi:hypothetical protein